MSTPDNSRQDQEPERPLRFLRMNEVEKLVGLGARTIHRKIKDDSFPQPVRLHGPAIGFVEAEVREWMERRIAERADV